MKATVIDTLRFANRLKEAGVEPRQAEAMSRAINDELTEGVVTKHDLDAAVAELKHESAAKFAAIDARFDAMDAKLESRFEATDARFDATDTRFDAMDARFDAMDEKFSAMFEALSTRVGAQGRYTFLVLALIAGLGLYNAAASHLVGASDTVAASAATPSTQATDVR